MQAPAPPDTQPHPRPTSGRRKPPSTLQPSSKQAPAIASHTVFTIKFHAPRVKRQPATPRSVILSLPTAGRLSEESTSPRPLPDHRPRRPALPLMVSKSNHRGATPARAPTNPHPSPCLPAGRLSQRERGLPRSNVCATPPHMVRQAHHERGRREPRLGRPRPLPSAHGATSLRSW